MIPIKLIPATDLYNKASANFEEKLAESKSLLKCAKNEWGDQLTQASSLGVEDVVISHLIDSLSLNIPIFILDTGRLNPETLSLLAKFKATSKSPVTVYHPDADSLNQWVTKNGLDSIYQSIELRKACCHIRKMEPLSRALSGKAAWITGLRREQSTARADVPIRDLDVNRVKYNPLADWSLGDVWHYVAEHHVPYNVLHDQFYPSIGCAPCTRAITIGEDFRAGRWWWEQESAKECGLHIKNH